MDNTHSKEKQMTKAQQVRALIAQAKAAGLDSNSLITAVMEQFGFARQLARAYINNNWSKVEATAFLVEQAAAVTKQPKALSMTKDAIRKREKRAAAKAAAQAVPA